MKYICLGYYDEKKFEKMSPDAQNAMVDECFAYDDELRKNGSSDRTHEALSLG